ncbi:MAG: mandelate racemase/muconate lactonizing enzyme family protein [Microlunatus sp.]|nr:mandelate racemase/muconate lactonizing enzyme family protein [Microlunatus sp.]
MTKIESVETYVLRVPLAKPVADSIYYREFWHIPVVELRTADGLMGTGYSGVWTGEGLLLDAIDSHLGPQIIGRDAGMIGEIWRGVYWSPAHWVGRGGVVHMAQGMIDIALWDIAAQRAGMPLWRLLGGSHSSLATYNTNGGWLNFSIDELIADITEMVDSGWSKVKVKVGSPDPGRDLERVRRVRAAIGPDVTLMIDVNQRWDLIRAREMARRLLDSGVSWIEEPLHPDDIAGHADLVRRSSIPIALGENLYNLEAFAGFLSADAVDIVQVDVTRVGGITEWLRIAQLAAGLGRWVVPHAGDMMQLHQHLVAGIGAGTPAMIEYLPWGLEAFEDPVSLDGSRIILPDKPGASSAIAPEARRRWGSKR